MPTGRADTDESFLNALDPETRARRGVYPTPPAVARFVVRGVDTLLRESFGLARGLADETTWAEMERRRGLVPPRTADPDAPFLRILEPAAGTGVFLEAVIAELHAAAVAAGEADDWPSTVRSLLSRFEAVEILPDAAALARTRFRDALRRTGVVADDLADAVVRVGNGLERSDAGPPVTVVLGNPPWANMSANLGDRARDLVAPFRTIAGEPVREKSAIVLERTLQDDYVKFLGLTDGLLLAAGAGAVGLVTNHGYLENVGLRGLRHRLLETFDDLRVIDLHGDAGKKRGDVRDESVFTIRTGAAVLLAARGGESRRVARADLRGPRADKLARLDERPWPDLAFSSLAPRPPGFLLRVADPAREAEYARGVGLDELFPLKATGVETGKDALLIGFEAAELEARLRRFADPTRDDADVRSEFGVERGCGRVVADRRRTILEDPEFSSRIRPILFAPFDERFVFYREDLLNVHGRILARALDEQGGLLLLVMRQLGGGGAFSHVFVTRAVPNNRAFYSTRGKVYGLHVPDDAASRRRLAVAYALLWSTAWRARYDVLLRETMPRVPAGDFAAAAALEPAGRQLLELHLGDRRTEAHLPLEAAGDVVIARPRWEDGRILLSADASIGGVEKATWELEIGGYRPARKWLRDRKGRRLDAEQLGRYRDVVARLDATRRLVDEIDVILEAGGGLPRALGSAAAERSA